MHKLLRYIAIVIASAMSLLLSGCATTQNYVQAMNSWRGSNIESLFKTWGYPNRTIKLANGHRLYIYRYRQRTQYPPIITPGYTTVTTKHRRTIVTNTQPVIVRGSTVSTSCTTWFEVNKQGTIIGTSIRGNSCTATQQQLQHYRRHNNATRIY